MAVTGVSALDQTIVARYESDYLLWAELYEDWGQFVNWKEAVPLDGGGGSSFDWPVFHALAPATTALTETDNITPVAAADSNVTITPYEYGNSVETTLKARFQSRVDLREAFAKVVAENRGKTVDHLIRAAIENASWVMYPGTAGARTDLDTTGEPITFAFITQLVQQARALGIPAWEGDTYVSVMNPAALQDIMSLNQWQYPTYYQGGLVNQLFRGEVGMLGGLRFVSSPHGKLYLSGGTTAQAATTLAASCAAGATTLSVSASAGLAAGSYITLGTLEAATSEIVQVTAQSGVDLTVRGIGNAMSNFGTAFSHASAAAVTESANVAMMPIIGRDTVWGVYGGPLGRYGKPFMLDKEDSGNLGARFLYLTWLWYGGVSAVPKYCIRGEFATTAKVIGKVTDY